MLFINWLLINKETRTFSQCEKTLVDLFLSNKGLAFLLKPLPPLALSQVKERGTKVTWHLGVLQSILTLSLQQEVYKLYTLGFTPTSTPDWPPDPLYFFPCPPFGRNEGLQCVTISFSGTSCELFLYLRFIISGMTLRVASGCLVMTTKCTHLTTLRNVAADAVFCEDGCCRSTGRRRFWLALYITGCPVREKKLRFEQ